MPETPRGRLFAYGLAVLATAISLLARWPLEPVLGDAGPHMTFFPAVMIAAYLGGFWPGLVATLLSAAVAIHFMTRLAALPRLLQSCRIIPSCFLAVVLRVTSPKGVLLPMRVAGFLRGRPACSVVH